MDLRNILQKWGYETYLPQTDGGIAFNLIENEADAEKIRQQVFTNDYNEVKKCDAILCVLDGRVPDEGLCVEVGMAYALGKICLGYKTDQRSLDKYGDNLMITGCLQAIAHSEKDLKDILRSAFAK